MKKFIMISLFAFTLFITGCKISNNIPVIEGAFDHSILHGETFGEMEGISATDVEDGDITDLIEVEGYINTSLIGEQVITYVVEDTDGNKKRVLIIVTITAHPVNQSPEIIGAIYMNIAIGTDFSLQEGVTATDAEDGNITDDITTSGTVDVYTLGLYIVDYKIIDSYGNETDVQRIIRVSFHNEPWQINNSEFTYGVQGWTVDYIFAGAGSFEIVDSVLEMNITNIGDDFTNVRMIQFRKSLDMDTEYIITFRAKADVARKVQLVVVDTETSPDGINYTNLLEEEKIFDITTTWEVYEFIFTPLNLTLIITKISMGDITGTDITSPCVEYEFILTPFDCLYRVMTGLVMGDITGTEAATVVYIDYYTLEEYIPD